MADTAEPVVIFSVAVYVAVGLGLLLKRWPVRAGVAMTLASLILLTWQVIFTESDAPGFALLLPLMLPTAIGVAGAGAVWWLHRRLAVHAAGSSQV